MRFVQKLYSYFGQLGNTALFVAAVFLPCRDRIHAQKGVEPDENDNRKQYLARPARLYT